MTFTSFEALREFSDLSLQYRNARRDYPHVPAARVLSAIRRCNDGDACSMDEALCPRHEFVCTGTQYGGDDERWHGEGRCLCIHCGADGDA